MNIMKTNDYMKAAERYTQERNNYTEFIQRYSFFREHLDKHSSIENALFQMYGYKCELVTSL